jgi:hypothetical protein
MLNYISGHPIGRPANYKRKHALLGITAHIHCNSAKQVFILHVQITNLFALFENKYFFLKHSKIQMFTRSYTSNLRKITPASNK